MNNDQPFCKICQQGTVPTHTINDITYYRCQSCQFLQNFYWEELPPSESDQKTTINQRWLRDHWLPAEPDHDYAKGWEILQLLAWPPAWQARQLNTYLQQLPFYEQWFKNHIKNRLHRIMDFGCGYGSILLQLAERDQFDIIGVDPYAPHTHSNILQQDLLNIDLDANSFDAIFSIETLEHIADPIRVFEKFYRLLKPGQHLLIQTRRQEDPEYQQQQEQWFYLKDPKTHVSIYSIPAMKELARRTKWSDVQFKGVKYARFRK